MLRLLYVEDRTLKRHISSWVLRLTPEVQCFTFHRNHVFWRTKITKIVTEWKWFEITVLLTTLPWKLSSLPVFMEFLFLNLLFSVNCFVDHFFSFCVFFWHLCCLSFFHLRLLITLLIYSNLSLNTINMGNLTNHLKHKHVLNLV